MSSIDLNDIDLGIFELVEYVLASKSKDMIPLAARAKEQLAEHDRMYSRVKSDPTQLRAIAILTAGGTYSMAKELEFPLHAITSHLNEMNELKDYHGMLYFMVLLSHSVGCKLPKVFRMFCVDIPIAQRMAGELYAEWLDMYADEGEPLDEPLDDENIMMTKPVQ